MSISMGVFGENPPKKLVILHHAEVNVLESSTNIGATKTFKQPINQDELRRS